MKNFEDFLTEKALPGDYDNLSESLNDFLSTNNVLHYMKAYMREEASKLLYEFWNSESDANTLEDTEQDKQVEAFEKFVTQKFK
jgi:hypothetical protein